MEKKTNYGRKPTVPNDKVFDELKSVAEDLFDSEGNLIAYSDHLWILISKSLDGKITPHNLYNIVSQNRHSWQIDLRNLVSRPPIEDFISPQSESFESDTNSETHDESNSSDTKNIYKFDIPYRDYISMHPIEVKYGKKKNAKTYTILKQGIWTNIINDWFIKLCKIPCTIMYKRCRISNDISKSNTFLTFSGKCKECGAIATGWANEKPTEAMPLIVNICLTEINKKINHISKRPLNAQNRIEIGQQLLHDCASNWVRNKVVPLKFGEKIPTNIYNKNVLRKCKQEKRDKQLGIVMKCPIMSLIEFKHSSHAGSIHSVCADPFIVHYWTACQLIVYKQFRKSSYARLAIDATGGIVQKLKRTKEGILSSHIFLYEGVISNGEYQVSVVQMVSERQDTFSIYSWLMMWLNEGVSAPQETVTDYSMALLGATSRAFCGGLTIREYVDSCLEALEGKARSKLTCYIRIDIAHIIKLVTRWSCWKGVGMSTLKEFYVRCTVLLINAKTLDSFKTILTDISTLAISRHCGKLLEWPENDCPSEVAKKRLLSQIKGVFEMDSSECYDILEDLVELEDDFDFCPGTYISELMEKIDLTSTTKSLYPSDDLNAYFNPEFKKNISRISKHFPLWSNVMTDFFKSPYSTATSATVEGDFAELKNKILRHDFKPMTADRFVITHLHNIKGSTKLARSQQLFPKIIQTNSTVPQISPTSDGIINISPVKSSLVNNSSSTNISPTNMKRRLSVSSSSSFDSTDTLKEHESWMGLKNEYTGPFETKSSRKIRPTKYTKPCQEIDRILNNSRMRSHKRTLILNGSISTQCKIKSNIYVVNNTCAFDSIVVAIAVAYNDNKLYKEFIDNSKNEFLIYAKDLAMQGSNKIIYIRRVELLKLYFEKSEIYPKVQSIDAECNVSKIINSYFRDDPCVTENTFCEICGETRRFSSPTVILPQNSDFVHLQQLINVYTGPKQIPCQKCEGIKISTRILNKNHIFIETDNFIAPVQLKNITKTLNEKYELVAIINFVSGNHYIAYIHRAHKSVWECMYNDLAQKITISKNENIEIHPHIILYIQVN